MARRVPLENGTEVGYATPTAASKIRASLATPPKSAGILRPPPDVRCIVDKTAEFVAQNGLEFEQKILSNEKRNPRFNFLKSKDVYHSYYQRRILEFLDQGQTPVKAVQQGGVTVSVPKPLEAPTETGKENVVQ